VVYPGRDTTVDVESKVFLRDKVGKLGMAPLTSMYLFGAESAIANSELPSGAARLQRSVDPCR
jgi:glucan biosynthesis protein